MEQQKINTFISGYEKYFPKDKKRVIIENLEVVDNRKYSLITSQKYRSPGAMRAVSFFFGVLGIDRFMTGSTGLGILKLFTGGLMGFMWFIDLFIIAKRAREYNFSKLAQLF